MQRSFSGNTSVTTATWPVTSNSPPSFQISRQPGSGSRFPPLRKDLSGSRVLSFTTRTWLSRKMS